MSLAFTTERNSLRVKLFTLLKPTVVDSQNCVANLASIRCSFDFITSDLVSYISEIKIYNCTCRKSERLNTASGHHQNIFWMQAEFKWEFIESSDA